MKTTIVFAVLLAAASVGAQDKHMDSVDKEFRVAMQYVLSHIKPDVSGDRIFHPTFLDTATMTISNLGPSIRYRPCKTGEFVAVTSDDEFKEKMYREANGSVIWDANSVFACKGKNIYCDTVMKAYNWGARAK